MEQPLVTTNSSNSSNATSISAKEAAKYNLRTKSIQNRIEVERRKNEPRHPKPKQRPAPLSKYRRRTANFRERCRMQEMNDAFKRLQSVVPGDESTAPSQVKQSLGTSAASEAAASKATKIHTLKLAVNYISALTAMLNGQQSQQSQQELCSAVPARTQTVQYSMCNTANNGNHCNQSSVSSQTMTFTVMGPKNKACQTVVGSCGAASQTEQQQQQQPRVSQHRIPDLNSHLVSSNHLNQCPTQQRPLHSYSYPSSVSHGCVLGQQSANKPVPPIGGGNHNLCEISPFYGYSNQPMSHQQQSPVQPPLSTAAVQLSAFGSADNISSNLFLSSGHSHPMQSVNRAQLGSSNIVSASPFDSLGDNASEQHYSLVSSHHHHHHHQALLDDFSAIIDDLQAAAAAEEDSTFALVDGLID